jgi:alpha/beta superfamily hydrolase
MHDGNPLPHTFFEGDGVGLMVILPGLHYGPDGPVLYHLAKRVQEAGWDTLGLTYGFQTSAATAWAEHYAECLEECRAALQEAMGQHRYPQTGIVGKSLGSMVLAQLCAGGSVPEATRLAYLTPPINNPAFASAFAETRHPAYLAIGTRDSFYDAPSLEALSTRRPALVRVLEGADHGLDVPRDLSGTLSVVGQVVEDVSSFFLTGEIRGLANPGPATNP